MLVPPYTIVRKLTPGGLGEVLVVANKHGQQFVAKFPKDHTRGSQQLIDDEARRFERSQGRYVVKYFGRVDHADGRRGFAMELMDGSLSDLITARKVSVEEAIEYFSYAAAGIAEVHASAPGAFHGDLKLANVLVKGRAAKLADFGLARGGAGQTQILGPHGGGTLGYFPPEGYSSAVGDVYSLGVVLWALLAGREPPASGRLPEIKSTTPVANLANSMLERDPAKRASIGKVLELLALARESEQLPNDDWFGDLLKFALGASLFGLGVAFVAAVLSGGGSGGGRGAAR